MGLGVIGFSNSRTFLVRTFLVAPFAGKSIFARLKCKLHKGDTKLGNRAETSYIYGVGSNKINFS